MAGFFFELGRTVGTAMRQGKWVFRSLTGTEAEALQAEHDVGRDLTWALLRQTPADADPALADLLARLGPRLARWVKDQRRRFTFYAVQSEEINAFALPGGFVFVTRPLVELCAGDEGELAFILGHEMAHVILGHAMDRIMNGLMLGAAARVAPAGGLVGAVLRSPAGQLLRQAYTRDQELEADQLGARLAAAAGFDRAAAVRLLSRLLAEAGGDVPLAGYFSSHPPFAERIARLRPVR